jgi:hypothetical protein
VAACARYVRIDSLRLEAYRAELPLEELRSHPSTLEVPEGLDPDERVAFVLVLDAVNFGSGYFPHLRKRPGMSGYRTIEASLRDRWHAGGPLTVDALRAADPRLCAEVFRQSVSSPEVAELMGLFARAWRDLAEFVEQRHGGDLSGPARSAGGSAAALVRDLCWMPFYRDVSEYAGQPVPFLKRAQITAHDLSLAVPPPLGGYGDLEALTIFADNLVPHVLRLDGVLVLAPELVERIERGELLSPGEPAEVEIRACAVHAVEQLVTRLRSDGQSVSAVDLDAWLWSRGQRPDYKAQPRHRTRTVFY